MSHKETVAIFCHRKGTQRTAPPLVTCNCKVQNRQLHLLSHAGYITDSSRFCHMQGTQRTAAPFVTCRVHNRQQQILSHARYTTNSCTFCYMQGTQQTAAPFVTCKVHNGQLHLLSHASYTTDSCTFCHMQGTQRTAAPFVTCKVHNGQLHLLSHARYTTDSCTFCHMQGLQQKAAEFLVCEVQSRLLRLSHLQGSQHTAGNRARYAIDRTFSLQGTVLIGQLCLLPLLVNSKQLKIYTCKVFNRQLRHSHIYCTLQCSLHSRHVHQQKTFLPARCTQGSYSQWLDPSHLKVHCCTLLSTIHICYYVCHKCRINITSGQNIFTVFNDGQPPAGRMGRE